VNNSLRSIMASQQARRFTAIWLMLALLMSAMSGVAHAADETVTGLEFDYYAGDYDSGTSSLQVFIEDDKVNLSVLASLSSSSSKQDVTTEATWKTSNSAIVKVDKGVLTGVGKGSATITATYKGVSASIKATSDYVYDSVALMQSAAEAPTSLDIEIGQSLVFTLSGTKGTETKTVTDDATWSTSNSAVATVDNGTITLAGVGSATITAKLKGKSDTITLKVTSPYKAITIGNGTSSNKLLELDIGSDDAELSATAELKVGGTPDITDAATWTSANTKIATVEKGVVTAVSAGKTTVTVAHKGVSSSIEVVVRSAYQSIKLSPEKEYHMQVQDPALQITASVLGNNNVEDPVTTIAEWTSSNIIVATVDSTGKVTPKAVGTSKITASYKGVSRSIDVTVYPSVTKISVEEETIDGFKGISGDLPKVTGTTFDGSTVDVTKLAKWTSEDTDVAVIKDGQWSAKALGESELTATVQGKTATAALVVHIKPLKLFSEVKDLSVIFGKDTAYPAVTVINEDGEEEDVSSRVKWTTTSDNIVLKPEAMKGIEVSTVTLTATYLNKSTTLRVKIEEEVVKFEVEPAAIELNPTRSKSIKVTAHYKSGSKASIGTKMNWTVDNEKLASVSGASVKALAVGTAKLTGTYQGKTVTVTVTIVPKLKSLTLSSKSTKLAIGGTYAASLQANYTTGTPVDVTSAAVWTTSKASVATVKDGKITAVGKGSASIKATFSGKSVTIRITVK
jgi:uncharacterized protein YjdB